MIFNFAIIIVICISLGIFLYITLKKNFANASEILNEDTFALDYLTNGIKESFNTILKTNVAELNLNKIESEKSERNKSKLRKALRTCSYGDMGAKEYIKEYIKELLQKKFAVTEESINHIIPFMNIDKLSVQDKFDILMYQYKVKHGLGALEKLLVENQLDVMKYGKRSSYYQVTEEDIIKTYFKRRRKLNFVDKLDIVAQRIYQNYKGHSVIDEIRDMKVDGVSAGVSGIPEGFYSFNDQTVDIMEFAKIPKSYNSIWIFFQGKTIHLEFLGFQTQRELERVCKNIYKYNNPGQLSESRGYIANDMKDGSRVIVVRPQFAESWAFFVRKFDSIKRAKITDLITDKNREIPVNTMKWLVKGCQVIGITGSQGCGKTTLLKSLIQYIN